MKRFAPALSRLLAVACLAGGAHALAQDASTNGAQGADPNPRAYLPNRAPDSLLQQKKFVDQFAAPPNLLPEPPDSTPPPDMPQPQYNNEQKRNADNQQNWMLLTPEEIFGIKKDKEKNALENDPDEDLTAEERFMKRQEMSRMNTNSSSFHQFSLDDDYWRKKDELKKAINAQGNNDFESRFRAQTDIYRKSPSPFAGLMSGGNPSAMDHNSSSDQLTPQSPWATSLWSPALDNNKPDPAHVADMENFHQLLNPASADSTPKSIFAPGDAGSSSAFASASTKANPYGASYAPIKDNIGRPAPLPTLTPSPDAKPLYTPRKPSAPPWITNPGLNNPPPNY